MSKVRGVVRRDGGEEKKDGDLKNLDQVFVSRLKRKTENLFSGRSRIFLNCLLFTIKKFTHCFFVLFPVSSFSDYAIHLLFITKY